MMSTFIPQLQPTITRCSAIAPNATTNVPTHAQSFPTPCPGAPVAGTVPLNDTENAQNPCTARTDDFYPIGLSTISVARQLELDTIVLTTPVHVHTPTAHIGLIHGVFVGQPMSALDTALTLQAIWRQPISIVVYVQLSPHVRDLVRRAFLDRNRDANFGAGTAWENYVSGQSLSNGPIGRDLLLGCTEIWGIEHVSLGGYSVVHLA
ncbi:hypothetical protein D9756_000029 [Leucocoprinus leucothites]|uniref:Uncharacterized protein n=1 Tax=Leucocoprinus leucothites TaxID=201217 RepID=A0A8H5GFH3_9AGAR|nr:hypothetical protein D9756_000029 [Leucoagaricus leucothites]